MKNNVGLAYNQVIHTVQSIDGTHQSANMNETERRMTSDVLLMVEKYHRCQYPPQRSKMTE